MDQNFELIEDSQKRWIDYVPSKPCRNQTILVLPGLNTLHTMDSYCRFLASHGYRVRSVKYEGQRERSKAFFSESSISTASVNDWIQNIEESYDSLRENNKPFAALVYSIGASLISLFMLRNPEAEIKSVFALAPALTLTKKAQFGLGVYRILSHLTGDKRGIYPSMVGKKFRAETFMSYSSYRKPKDAITQIHDLLKTRNPKKFETAWTIVTDPNDILVDSDLFASELAKLGFPPPKISLLKRFGHDFAFTNSSEYPTLLLQTLTDWLAELSKLPS
ncbi:MAG: hypothetical protein HRU09_10980 [Oligoflexales bacterium]|nr:hypothetical protein [Oligoflexales bacterium]